MVVDMDQRVKQKKQQQRSVTHVMRFGKRDYIASFFLRAWWEFARSCNMASHTVSNVHVPVELIDVWTHRLDASVQPLLDTC